MIKPDFSSIIDILRKNTLDTPEKLTLTFLKPHGEVHLTNQMLLNQAELLASRLISLAEPGSRAIILLQSSEDYVISFLGCLIAGCVAVPAYPPTNNRHNIRLFSIIKDACVQVIITTKAVRERYNFNEKQGVKVLAIDEKEIPSLSNNFPDISGDHLAFLQYTSGSTGAPKGVMVSHGNIIANTRILDAFSEGKVNTTCFWIPPFHDMGLIGGILYPLLYNKHCILMHPAEFLKNPFYWLKAVSDYKVNSSAAPNYGYEFCLKSITETEKKKLDLSHWILAINGSEPVNNLTLNKFKESFKECGFRAEMFCPSYGMAETTLFISGKKLGSKITERNFDKKALQENRVKVSADPVNSSCLVGCGIPDSSYDLKIIDPDSHVILPVNTIGEIVINGSSVAQGYWGKPELTHQVFKLKLSSSDKHFLRTGDLGFLDEHGELFITGRLKDMIVIRGQNLYPQDIEQSLDDCHPMLIAQGNAAFLIEYKDNKDTVPQLIIVQEIHRHAKDYESIFTAILNRCSEELPLLPSQIVLIRQGTLPKTSSGKVQRHACRDEFLHDELRVIKKWQQKIEQNVSFENLPPLALNDKSSLILWMQEWFAHRFSVPKEEINPIKNFNFYGVDSVTAVQFTAALGQQINREVDPGLLWSYTTIADLADYLFSSDHAIQKSEAIPSENAFEPIAIVGMSCRFPGGSNNPQQFWDLLQEAKDGVTKVPSSRWDHNIFNDKLSPYGGFIDNVDQFDASLFDIKNYEAESMDPQHRFLLEVTWQALEDAGISPLSLNDSKTGIFIGISSNDYSHLGDGDSEHNTNAFYGLGNAHSAAAGRIAYFLGTKGEALAIDTACSSSLVALVKGCQDLQNRQCDMAIIGAVNHILSPSLSVSFANAGMLSTKGRCQVFDADADGYVRSEGCGVVILKNLKDAEENGDRILAVIRSAVVNSDGHSNGITAPNPESQKSLIKQALSVASLEPDEVDYIEAHGTGTILGDPIEFNALKDIFATGKRTKPLVIGAVKSNIGHLEAAAGMAGIIKVILMLQHNKIPGNLHVNQVNPLIDLSSIPAQIPTQLQTWQPDSTSIRKAGISSFGFTGTNAHIIVSDYNPKMANILERVRPVHLFALSAHSPVALQEQRKKFLKFIQHNQSLSISQLCHSTNVSRSGLSYRLGVLAKTIPDLIRQLNEWSPPPTLTMINHRVVFLFSGQGSPYSQKGWELYENHPVFKKAVDFCFSFLDAELLSLKKMLFDPQKQERLNHAQYIQLSLFILEYSLATLWRSVGIEPWAVIGHDVGEYVAATIAGILTLEQALKLVLARSKLMHAKLKTMELPRVHAIKSELLQSEIGSFIEIAEQIEYSKPSLVFISNVTGKPQEQVDKDYWVNHLINTVPFSSGIDYLIQEQPGAFIEIGSEPVLLHYAQSQHPEPEKILWLPSLQKHDDYWSIFSKGLCELYTRGYPVNWNLFDKPFHIKHCNQSLPEYSFQHQSFWLKHGDKKDSCSIKQSVDAFTYSLKWKKIKEISGEKNYQPGMHLIFLNSGSKYLKLAQNLVNNSDQLILVQPGHEYKELGSSITINPMNSEHFYKLISLISPDTQIFYLWGLNQKAQDFDANYFEMCHASAGLLHLTQALTDNKHKNNVYVVTQGATSLTKKSQLIGSPLIGMGKTFITEFPELCYQHIDFDSEIMINKMAEYLLELPHSNLKSPFITITVDGIFEPYLQHTPVNHSSAALVNEGTFIITGGMGGLGFRLCHDLIRQGVKSIVLLGRRHFDEDMQSKLNELQKSSKDVVICYKEVDISNKKKLSDTLLTIQATMLPINAIFHAAGVLQDRMWPHLRWDDFETVYRSKIIGSINLHELSIDLNLELNYFVLFSSISSLIGPAGQGNYSAANGFLDALAHLRKQRGLPALSINFGPWKQLGMTQSYTDLSVYGIDSIDEKHGLSAIEIMIGTGHSQLCYLPNHIKTEHLKYFSDYQKRMLSGLIQESDETLNQENFLNREETVFLKQLKNSSKEESLQLLTDFFETNINSLLRTEHQDGLRHKTLAELGMDSILANELLFILKRQLPLGAVNARTLLFENRSVDNIAHVLNDEIHNSLYHKEMTVSPKLPITLNQCVPLVPHQAEMMQYIDSYPFSTAYNLPAFIKIDEILDVKKITKAIEHVIERNELLKAAILKVYGQYYYCVEEKVPFSPHCFSITEQELNNHLTLAYQKRIDLDAPPLFNCNLFYVDNKYTVMAFVFHHVVADGASIYYFLQDLFECLNNSSQRLDKQREQFSSYVNWLFQHVYPKINTDLRIFWENKLKGYKGTHLFLNSWPDNGNIPPKLPLQGKKTGFILDRLQLDRLEQFASQNKCTVAIVLQAVVHKVLYNITKKSDTVLIVFSAARNNLKWRDAIGQVAQHPMIRCQNIHVKPLNEIAAFIMQETAEIDFYQFMPSFKLKDFNLDISKISFDFQLVDPEQFALHGAKVEFLSVSTKTIDLWGDDPRHLAFKIIQQKNQALDFSLKYRLDMYTKEQAEIILEECRKVIYEIVGRDI
ncbi:MAG: SDR family NAD(P)-dependent oxidoreductase [Legionella sp.]|nr:SDR family NAD(P)-dependent oxidoreductase [Legionella sp.]